MKYTFIILDFDDFEASELDTQICLFIPRKICTVCLQLSYS